MELNQLPHNPTSPQPLALPIPAVVPSVFKKSAASGSYYRPHTVYETNMPSSVLRDAEATRKLLEVIKDTPSGSRTLAWLARTCKSFNEPAMDVLWNELDSFLPLIGLFPGYIMKRARRPVLGLVRPVS